MGDISKWVAFNIVFSVFLNSDPVSGSADIFVWYSVAWGLSLASITEYMFAK